jgi:hypothetical protein
MLSLITLHHLVLFHLRLVFFTIFLMLSQLDPLPPSKRQRLFNTLVTSCPQWSFELLVVVVDYIIDERIIVLHHNDTGVDITSIRTSSFAHHLVSPINGSPIVMNANTTLTSSNPLAVSSGDVTTNPNDWCNVLQTGFALPTISKYYLSTIWNDHLWLWNHQESMKIMMISLSTGATATKIPITTKERFGSAITSLVIGDRWYFIAQHSYVYDFITNEFRSLSAQHLGEHPNLAGVIHIDGYIYVWLGYEVGGWRYDVNNGTSDTYPLLHG